MWHSHISRIQAGCSGCSLQISSPSTAPQQLEAVCVMQSGNGRRRNVALILNICRLLPPHPAYTLGHGCAAHLGTWCYFSVLCSACTSCPPAVQTDVISPCLPSQIKPTVGSWKYCHLVPKLQEEFLLSPSLFTTLLPQPRTHSGVTLRTLGEAAAPIQPDINLS